MMFAKNSKLAFYCAKRFSSPRDPAINHEDLLQSAMLGLWVAILNFNPEYGTAFSTYAVPMINGQILRQLRDMWALKEPRVYKDIRGALSKHGFTIPLTDEEVQVLVDEGRFSRAQIMDFTVNSSFTVSLDEKMQDHKGEKGATFIDMIPDNRFNLDKEVLRENLDKIIEDTVKLVKTPYRDMVEEWMFSLLYEKRTISQMELAKKYKVSQAYVSRILKQATQLIRDRETPLEALLD